MTLDFSLNNFFQLNTEHTLEVQRLKEQLITTTNELEKQNKISSSLQANTKVMIQKIENFYRANVELSEKLKASDADKKELEKCLDDSNALNKEQMLKATESFQKLQETIKVADEAMVEIEMLMNEKRQMEDECSNLAQTIGSVMESASEKIEKDMKDLSEKHLQEIESSKIEIERLKQEVLLEKAKVKSSRFV